MSNTTQDTIFIGDNLTALKELTAQNFLFDIIYIDPPYNTGNTFSYNDSRDTQQWLNFLEGRLVLAKQLLTEDGVIFISIDDSCLYELKILCDNIFEKKNFLGNFITKQAVRSNSKQINTIHEYVLVYAKNKTKAVPFKIKRVNAPITNEIIKKLSSTISIEFKKHGKTKAEKTLSKYIQNIVNTNPTTTWLRNYRCLDDNGKIFFPKDLSVPGEPNELIIDEINLHLLPLTTRKWSSPKKFIELYNENRLCFKAGRPYSVHYLDESTDNVVSILNFYSRQGTNDLNKLGIRNLFDTPKPVELIKYLIRIATYGKKSARVLDFFAGSGTTGQAVMEINKEDASNHSFYLVQIDEKIKKSSPQYSFAINHNLKPTIDQLTIYRLKIASKKLNYDNELLILSEREKA